MNRFLWASYGMYFLGGTTSVLLGAIMPELLIHYHTAYTSGGILVLLGSIGFIVGVPITANCMRRFHYRFILSGAALAVAIAQIGVLCLPPFFLLGILVVLNGIGAASLETAVASYIMEQFEGRRAIFMSRLEVAFGIGALSLPALASLFIAMHSWRFTSLFIAVIALILSVFWQTISYSLQSPQSSSDSGQGDAQTAAPPIFNGMLSKYSVLVLFLLMILIYVGVEGSLNSFLPSIFTVDLKSLPYLASLSSTVFWSSMVLGRLVIGWIVRRVSYERYLFGSIVMGSVFFLVLIESNTPWLSYLAIFGLGLSLSAVYSITMVYANHIFPGMERTVTSSVTAFAGVGGAVFPAMIGYAMDHLLPKQVLWMILGSIILLLVSFLVIYLSLHIIRQRYWARES
ncbi:MFS transporter [Alicyclobacillus fastidiosus]|uniref:MFS transporter n=1 Tax=Alicyclobacillus fastidiosus TaxID=392011 RepID=A0ABV5AJF8_9BACL|nr:MFS transporter [Alicyclobacillus fastidiosus]WEH11571.1 MFS transporter [Alicyclobacillus fastidiosus]